MDPSTGLGTIAVGSVTELANILTNMSPEQLQNVRLDPALYSALSQTIDPAPQTELYDIQNLNQQLVTQPQQVSGGLDMSGSHVVQQPNNQQSFINQQQPSNQSFISQSIPLLTTTDQVQAVFLSPIKTGNTIQIQQEQQSQPVFLSNVSQPSSIYDSSQVSLQSVVQANPFVVQDLTQFQGILPGQASSLILTPTVMSQVQPTATVQTLKITDAQVLGGPLTATIDVGSQIATQSFMTPVQTLNLGNNLPTSLYPSTININPNMFTTSTSFETVDNNTLNSAVLNTTPQNQQLVLNGNAVVANNLPTQQFLISGMVDTGQQVLLPDTGQQVLMNGIPQHTVFLPTQTISPNVTSCQSMIIKNVSNKQPHTILSQQVPTTQTLKLAANAVAGTTQTLKLGANAVVAGSIILQNGEKVSLTQEQLSEVLKGKKVYTTQARNPTIQSKPVSKVTSKPLPAKKLPSGQNDNNLTASCSNIVVKTVNVISNSEAAQNVQMKPKSVEQVQPGVFKFQLTKVDNASITVNKSKQNDVKTHRFHNYNIPTDIKLPLIKHGLSNVLDVHKNIIATTSSVSKINKVTEQSAGTIVTTSQVHTTPATSQTKSYSGISTARLLEIAKKINLKNQSSSVVTTPVIKSGQSNTLLGKIKTPFSIEHKTVKVSLPMSGSSSNSFVSIKRPSPVSGGRNTVMVKQPSSDPTHPIVVVKTNNIKISESPAKVTALSSMNSTTLLSNQTVDSKLSTNTKLSKSIMVGTKLATSYPSARPIKGISIAVSERSKTDSVGKDTIKVASTKSMSSNVPLTKRKNSIDQELQTPLDHMLECEERGFVSPTSEDSNSPPKQSKSNFNRSFKRPIVVLENIKSNSKTTNNVSKEETEILSFRKAIKSCQVGGENAMRELAKLEIENQLKRFSQKSQPSTDDSKKGKIPSPVLKKKKIISSIRKDIKPANIESPISKSDALPLGITKRTQGDIHERSTKIKPSFVDATDQDKDIISHKVKKRKISESSSGTTHQEDIKEKQADTQNIKSSKSKEDKDNHTDDSSHPSFKKIKKEKIKKEINETSDSSIHNECLNDNPKKEDDSRKRERPKRFDDFIFPAKAKKDKKIKKFFFPKENVSCVDKNDSFEFDDTKTSHAILIDQSKRTNMEEDDEDAPSATKSSSTLVEPSTSSSTQVLKENRNIKLNHKKKYSKKKKKESKVVVELEVLPGHLKIKPKTTEDAVIDLSKIKLKSSFAESSYTLNDTIEYKTYKLLMKSKWVCTLCGKPGNLGSLDVLFGPYKLKVACRDESKDIKMSVWMHRDCAIWTSSICLANQTLTGLGDALDAAAKTPCSLCSQVGATLECGFKQCRDGYHFVCAKQRGCSFKMESFTMICPKHK